MKKDIVGRNGERQERLKDNRGFKSRGEWKQLGK
jgi:hypothetical protein